VQRVVKRRDVDCRPVNEELTRPLRGATARKHDAQTPRAGGGELPRSARLAHAHLDARLGLRVHELQH
jgi:hypothetical protein